MAGATPSVLQFARLRRPAPGVKPRGGESGDPKHSAEAQDPTRALDGAQEASLTVGCDAKAGEADLHGPDDREEDAEDGE